jgi:Zn-dependent alcohol dehydrogenase
VRIIASDGGLFNPSTDMKKLIKLVSKNYKLFEKIITHEVNLKDVNKGLSLVEGGRAIRVLVKIS